MPKDDWLAIGVMSGTSADAADAVVVRLWFDPDAHVQPLGLATMLMPPHLRERILAACQPDGGSSKALSELNVFLGEMFAAVALEAVRYVGTSIEEIDVIGCHGQTVYHAGNAGPQAVRSTLQLGDPAVIAQRTGRTVVSGFRGRDIAADGQGAPLVPYVDWLLYRSPAVGRVLLNIGGIANVTVLPAGADLDGVIGFDTGPGNMAIDSAVALATDGQEQQDTDGQRAARGSVDGAVLGELLGHPFFKQPPPKSAGREEFGEHFARALWQRWPAGMSSTDDFIATLTALTVESIGRALHDHVFPNVAVQELYVSGGGSENPAIMAGLRRRLPELALHDSKELGVASEAREAVDFAVLAVQALRGVPTNVPSVTGARSHVVLGSITPGFGLLFRV